MRYQHHQCTIQLCATLLTYFPIFLNVSCELDGFRRVW